MSTDILQVCLLGPTELSLGPQRLQLPATRKALGLLAYLLLNRALSQPRDRLAALFWGNRPDEKARGSLSTALWQINHSLPGKTCVLGESFTVQFAPGIDVWLDAEQFERLAGAAGVESLLEAVRLYRGDFLEGFYDDWVLHERNRLEILYLDALERLMIHYEASGATRLALATAQRLLEKDSLCEDAHCCAMRCYMTLGQRSAALEQYARCTAVLRDELQVEPLPETTQLYQAMLGNCWQNGTQEPAQAIQGDILLGMKPGGYDPLAVNVTPPCWGREAEMQALQTAWMETAAGKSCLVLVSGEVGVGKTRLVQQFMDALRWRDIPVLNGSCYEFERHQPYQPVVEALQSALPGTIQVDVQEDSRPAAYFEAVARALSSLSTRQGLLLVVEDLHWAGQSTLELLHYLVRQLRQQPVMLLGTLRDDEPAAGVVWGRFKEALQCSAGLREIHLRRLSVEAVEALISELSGQGAEIAPLSRRLFKETDGNPFFLMQVLKALFEHHMLRLGDGVWQGDFEQLSLGEFPLPDGLGEVILNRYNRLDQGSRAAAATAAVIGREFDYRLLRQVLAWKDERLLLALDELLRHKLVEETSGALQRDYSFTHSKVQEVIYASLPRYRRMRLHARVANSIEKIHLREDAYVGELAHHFLQAQYLDDCYADKAIDYLLKAGDQARLMYANQEATHYYQQALDLLKVRQQDELAARVQMKLGQTYQIAYQFEQAEKAYELGFRLWVKPAREERTLDGSPLQVLRTNWRSYRNIDPTYAMYFEDALGNVLFSGLMTVGTEMELLPDLALRWEVQTGGREYIFHLREGLHWSDGSPLNAYDFHYAARRLLEPALQSPHAGLLWAVDGAKAYYQGEISDFRAVGVQVLDPLTLRFKLEYPQTNFLFLLTAFFPAPRACIETFGEAWTRPEHILTNGPYRLQSCQADLIRMVRNEGYHGEYKGNIGAIELHIFPAASSQPLDSYQAGQLDVVGVHFCPTIYDAIRHRFSSEFFSFPNAGVMHIAWNVGLPPFQDERIRQAFAHSIDTKMISVILNGRLFPPSGGFLPACIPGHTPGIGLKYDPQRAQYLLAQAGYPQGKGFPVVYGISRRPVGDPVHEYLSEQWQSLLGVTVRWESEADLAAPVRACNFSLRTALVDYPDPFNLLGVLHEKPEINWHPAEYSRLIEETRLCQDQSQRLALFSQADRLAVESAVVIPLGNARFYLLIKPWVKHYPVAVCQLWFWKDVVIEPH